MPNLKDLKIRIDSVKSTRKITKAMQMVAAAKLRKAQESAERGRPYAEKMRGIVANLANTATESGSVTNKFLMNNDNPTKYLIIVATAERGLCGGFNSSIVKLARLRISDLLKNNKNVKILTIGKKGREQLKRDYGSLFDKHVDLSSEKNLTFETAKKIAAGIITNFEGDDFEIAEIFYNRFESVISQIPSSFQILPVEVSQQNSKKDNTNFDFEPDEEEILNELVPKSIATTIFSVLQENAASEQGSRMAAMDNATRNAGEMIDKLTIDYNRSRQAAITNELIEIISGAEAL
ncbi:F0F1 ATP synthase subunit gamma [bacterium TMED277]|nr:MAG: F0F1 ATP synthase subunit gamma [bacterium TMED277]|tara:strand:- start:1481 stop:2359 length:879 start_codon:yes stop_codon:yes gene_type:complete